LGTERVLNNVIRAFQSVRVGLEPAGEAEAVRLLGGGRR
jgi:hypothetical protein